MHCKWREKWNILSHKTKKGIITLRFVACRTQESGEWGYSYEETNLNCPKFPSLKPSHYINRKKKNLIRLTRCQDIWRHKKSIECTAWWLCLTILYCILEICYMRWHIISQCIHTPKYHVVQFKYTQFLLCILQLSKVVKKCWLGVLSL